MSDSDRLSRRNFLAIGTGVLGSTLALACGGAKQTAETEGSAALETPAGGSMAKMSNPYAGLRVGVQSYCFRNFRDHNQLREMIHALGLPSIELWPDGHLPVDTPPEEPAQIVTDYKTADGLPREYRLEGEDIILEPAVAASDVTLADGLIYHYTREVDGFAATDTTQEPGFAEPFHRIISLGMAYDWLLVNGPLDKADRVRQEIEVLMADLREFYSDRARDAKASIQPAHRQRDFF